MKECNINISQCIVDASCDVISRNQTEKTKDIVNDRVSYLVRNDTRIGRLIDAGITKRINNTFTAKSKDLVKKIAVDYLNDDMSKPADTSHCKKVGES